jgi:hypothetical protein
LQGLFPAFILTMQSDHVWMQILAINTTARNACVTGDLTIATKLLTQDIDADSNDYDSYANRSFVMARKADWDRALDDAQKVTVPPRSSSYIQANLYGDIEHQHSAIFDGLYLLGHRPLWKTTVQRCDESV